MLFIIACVNKRKSGRKRPVKVPVENKTKENISCRLFQSKVKAVALYFLIPVNLTCFYQLSVKSLIL